MLLLSQFPEVDRANLGTLHNADDDAVVSWILGVAVESDEAAARLAQQLSAMLSAAPLPHNVDLLPLESGSQSAMDFAEAATPFCDRARGGRLLLGAAGSLQ